MDDRDREYLREAVRNFHKNLESSLGRVISREEKGKDGYMRYIRIINEVRDYADRKRIPVKQAAKELSR